MLLKIESGFSFLKKKFDAPANFKICLLEMNSKFEEKSTTKFDPAERSISIRRRWRSSQRPVPAVSHGPRSACRCTRHTLHCCVRASLEREKNEKKKKKSGPFWELLKHILVVSSVALKKIRRKLLFLF